MIEFTLPALSMTLTEYMELTEQWESCSSCVGFCVSLGEEFFSSGVKEVDTEIMPNISSQAGPNVIPRVLPSYSILYWFARQVCYVILIQISNRLCEWKYNIATHKFVTILVTFNA